MVVDGKEHFTVQYVDKESEDREARFIRDGSAVVNEKKLATALPGAARHRHGSSFRRLFFCASG